MLGKYQNNFTKKTVMNNHKTSGVLVALFEKSVHRRPKRNQTE